MDWTATVQKYVICAWRGTLSNSSDAMWSDLQRVCVQRRHWLHTLNDWLMYCYQTTSTYRTDWCYFNHAATTSGAEKWQLRGWKSHPSTRIYPACIQFVHPCVQVHSMFAYQRCVRNYFVPGAGEKYCDPHVRSHISKTTCPHFTKFSVHLTCGSVVLWLQRRQLGVGLSSTMTLSDSKSQFQGHAIDYSTFHCQRLLSTSQTEQRRTSAL